MSTTSISGPRGLWWPPALLILAYLLLNAGGFGYYKEAEQSLVDTVGLRLLASTERVASELDGYRLAAWADPLLDTMVHSEVDRLLVDLTEREDFESFELFTPLGVPWLEATDDTLQESSEVALAAGVAFLSAAAGIPGVSRPYESRGEYFLAACAPIYDFDSLVVAVAVGEAGSEYFTPLNELRSGLLLLDGFAGLLFLTIGLIWTAVQRRLNRMEAAAVRSAQLAAMGQMVATVAHELKNPLGIIKNTAERIKKKYGTDDGLFDFIPEEVDRLDGIVRRYLQFARMETAEPEPVPLASLVTKLQLQLTDADTSTPIELDVPEDLVVRADPAALRQVLLNVLLNATEACRRQDGGEVSLSASDHGATVEIVVTDSGGGMDRETLARVAEPFFTTRTDGSGLGIYLAQTLTEKMKGRMTIESTDGRGTKVSLSLPAGRQEG